MINLHAVKRPIPQKLARAAAILARIGGVKRFRLTGEPLTEAEGDYSAPLEYHYRGKWDRWTNQSLRDYSEDPLLTRHFATPTEAQIEKAYSMFEERP